MGGGINGHPKGTFRGAIAARQAIEAVIQHKTLKEFSKNHLELRYALELWGKK
jgi:ribulose 1,5-bisphosphate carboxylase large subunit-like protein